MPTKIRIVVVGILILLGAACFCYFVFFHPTEIATHANVGLTTVNGPETLPVKAASTAGIERDKSGQALYRSGTGQANQTGSERRSRPKSGST
jgi:hypothetical protein